MYGEMNGYLPWGLLNIYTPHYQLYLHNHYFYTHPPPVYLSCGGENLIFHAQLLPLANVQIDYLY